jgi:alpha-2-macroglobulin
MYFSKNNAFNSLAIILFLFTFSLFSSCKRKQKITEIDAAYAKYIDAYTSGVVSKKNSIRIQFASSTSVSHNVNDTIKENLFEFSPNVEGKAFWVDARTIEFKPSKDLKPDELYDIEFKLNKIVDVPSKYKTFKFNIQTIKPSFEVEENGLKALDKENMTLSGQIATADVEDSKLVESILKVKHDNDKLQIKWQHNEANKTHSFFIEGIIRDKTATTLLLEWNGNPLNINLSNKKEITIPAIGDFKVLGVKILQDQEQCALVQFSDPLLTGQQLNGLITINNIEDPSYSISGSEVKIYAATKLDGSYTVTVNTGVENMWNEKLQKQFTANVFFENRLPSVKILGKGVILPSSGSKLVLPFEATNLKAVDVSIIKIFENNIGQFLQYNNIDGDNDLRRVARPLVQATVKLDDDKSVNLHKKNRFSLDLDKYIKTEPGAIYRVNIGFRPSYSLYTCTGFVSKMSSEENEDEYYYDNNNKVDDDDDFWRRYDSYNPYGYNWDERDNPCSKSYYSKERFASRNILATNIGLTAKRGSDGKLFVIATNLITTEPFAGLDLQVLDYQQQIIGTSKSSSDGIALIDVKRKPYLLIAKKGNEKSYLKLDDGSSLPLSRFDVDGVEVKNGIKGFIFGERGVWRPGDSLYLGCIIEDKEKKLPAEHPIEMELISPKGQLYKRMVAKNSADGFNVFKTATDANAPTGNWICRVKLGGAVFEKRLKIETVMPNRLKINLNFGTQTSLGKNATVNGVLSAKWLFGATAQNLKAKVDVQLYNKTTTFNSFKDYVFDNPSASFTPISKTIFDGNLSADGTAPIKPNFDVSGDVPGMLLANMQVKVFETGGNFSIDNVSMPYHYYNSYVGVKIPEGDKQWGYLTSGKTQSFSIVDVNTNGALNNAVTEADVELYKIQWRWWWDNSSNEVSNFTESEFNKLIKKETVKLVGGKAVFNNKFGVDEYGRYLIIIKDKISGHKTGKVFYVEDDSWQTRTDNNEAGAASMLSFTSDKEKYNVGDNATLTIPSSKQGRALISIETGSKVLKTFWIETKQGETKYSFKVEKEMTPNVYVNVSLTQPHAQTINDLPIRMYGVLPINVEDKNTILKPVIKINDVIKPEENSAITVSEESGKSFSYVVAIVDEGLLDLTRFKTPNPHEAFYAKEALGVKSWDLYDYVIGAWGGELQRILTIGGDAENELNAKTRKANRFSPVVKFMGPFKSNGSSKTHHFTLPPYMGSVRAMVIAAGNGAYGFAEKAVAVKNPLMLLTTLPRVLAPTEEFKIPVTVFATENNIKNVNVTIQSNGLVDAVGSTNVTFNTTGEQVIYVNAKVKAAVGIGKIKVIATSGKEKTITETEIDVRNPNPSITQVSDATLQAGQSYTSNITIIGDANSAKATVEISSIPAINLQKRLSYLIQYPHGCIEQTTSAVFPQLVLNDVLELNEQRKAEIARNISVGIQKIQNFQQQDGGFSYWPSGGNSDEWGTNYAGHFLLEASAKGYNVSSSMLQQWRNYEKTKAVGWNVTEAPNYGTDLTQAYRLYLLALAKAPEMGAMNRLKEYKFLTVEAKWRLSAAYYVAGQTTIALQLISGLPTTFPQRTYWGVSYGSDLRDEAMVLETLTLMNRRTEATQKVKDIANKLSQESWYSTQTTAYSLLAIAKYSGSNKDNKKMNGTVTIGNQNININTTSIVTQTNVVWQNGKANIQLKNNGNNVLFVRVINEGKPFVNEVVAVNNNPNILQVNAVYLDTKGNAIDITKIKQGTDFVAKVAIKNTGNRGMYSQMALSQIFPSGWEILNTRLYNSEGAFKSSASDYMDIRDDRVYQYFNLKQAETVTFYVQLNAAYIGKYYFPGVYAEAMYDHTISGGTSGKWVVVNE